jgi:radical SAM superfamily enzyme YgiQ (UPF0313 family)
MAALRKGKLDIERLSMDIFAPVDDEFVREVASIGIRVVLYICPDTGADSVRMAQGRCYTTEELLESVKICHRYHIPVQIFFSVGLVGETRETIKEMWQLWDKLSALDKAAIDGGSFGIYIDARIPIGGPIVGPIILEPGSLAFDFPEKHGYKLSFDNLEKYVAALSEPSWHQWLNHETKQLDREAFIELIFSSVAYSVLQRSRYGVYDDAETAFMHFRNNADRFAVKEIDYIMSLPDPVERGPRLKSLKDSIDSALDQSTKMDDLYGYQKIINDMLDYYFPLR